MVKASDDKSPQREAPTKEDGPIQPAAVSKGRRALKFLTECFAVISAAAIILAVLSSARLLIAYLRVFDWQLIWIVEYTDVLKVGLVAVAVLMDIASTAIVITPFDLGRIDEKARITTIILFLVLFFFVIGFSFYFIGGPVYFESKSQSALLASFGTCASIVGLTVFMTVREITNPQGVRASRIPGITMLWVLVPFFIGNALGYYVKLGPVASYDVFLKEDVLHDARIVVLTSHHFVFYANGKTIVVPAADVIRFEAQQVERPQTF